MGNLHLVTGYAGQAHIKAEDHASLNASIVGSGQYVFDKGNKLSASAITSNTIRVLDGDILMQGRHIRLAENSYVDLAIENGSQGMLRNDLIVARYTKNSGTGVEDCNLVVIKGTAVASDPADPEYTVGDIINDHALQNDMPLYRVPLNGLTIGELVPLFTMYEQGSAKHASKHSIGGDDPISPSDIGALASADPFLWRTVEAVSLNLDSCQSFAKNSAKKITLPVAIDLSKYKYEFKVECFGLQEYSNTTLNKNAVVRLYLYSQDEAADQPLLIGIRNSVAAGEMEEHLGSTNPTYISAFTDSNNELEGMLLGLFNGDWTTQGATVAGGYANDVYPTLFVEFNSSYTVETFGILFSYRAYAVK